MPYRKVQVEKLVLLEKQNMVQLIDYWLVHKNKKFMD
jgi:hypothetical protein